MRSTTRLAPWSPTLGDPFDDRKAAHLLRRAGLGASPAEVDRAVKDGLDSTVEGLFDEAKDEEALFSRTFETIAGDLVDFSDVDQLRGWWVYRMARTRVPLREKLALFWHGHFASSIEKVEESHLMHRQVEMLRRLAWGNFHDLVSSIARDPAMIAYLDGDSNTKAHPNENFARELMELFTCGIGHYTELDVQAAARAFTGWHRDGSEFAFKPDEHDDARKRFLGKSGKFDGGDIIDILIQHPATPRRVATKLLRFFASPDPSSEVIEEATALLVRTRLDVKWFLLALFQSRYFFSSECYRARISSPVEFLVGAMRTLGVRRAGSDVAGPLKEMGQALFAPPNVKGWDGEGKWINSSTLAARAAARGKDLDVQGVADRVVVMAFSEFGRRVDENASAGTDHGAASNLFLMGPRVKGGLVGSYPSLANLGEGDLVYNTDFRSVYATLLDDWLGCSAGETLGGRFPRLDLIRS